jgi:hypothetical protein
MSKLVVKSTITPIDVLVFGRVDPLLGNRKDANESFLLLLGHMEHMLHERRFVICFDLKLPFQYEHSPAIFLQKGQRPND